jgi:hypothetical protein
MNTNTQTSPSHLADAPAEDRLAFAISEVARQFSDRTAIVAGAGGDSIRTIDYATLAAAITPVAAIASVATITAVAPAIAPVAVVTIDHAPVNALSRGVRQGLLDAVRALDADPAVSAIVLSGGPGRFIAGADLREMALPPDEPFLPEVVGAIDASTKPVVAAQAHARIDHSDLTALLYFQGYRVEEFLG